MSDGKRSVRVAFKGGIVGRLFKVNGSDRWYLSYWHAGHEYRETTGTADFDAARAKLKKKLEEMASVRRGHEPFVDPKGKRLTVNDLLSALETDYTLRGVKAVKQAKSHMQPLRDAFGPWRALEVTPEVVDREIERWLADDVAPATINRRTQLLGQAFRIARRRLGFVPTFRRLRESNARQGFVTPEQFEAIASCLRDPYDDLARLAYAIGWRKGELQSLTAANVDLRAGELRIGDSKNGAGRVIPMRDADGSLNTAGRIIERRLAARRVGNQLVPWLFHKRIGKGLALKSRPVGDFRKAWCRACIEAGFSTPKLDEQGRPVLDRNGRAVLVATVRFHDLRRSFARDAVDSGNDPHVVCRVGGWKTMAVMNRYNIVDTKRMATALSRLEAARNAAPATTTAASFAQAAEGQPRKKHGK